MPSAEIRGRTELRELPAHDTYPHLVRFLLNGRRLERRAQNDARAPQRLQQHFLDARLRDGERRSGQRDSQRRLVVRVEHEPANQVPRANQRFGDAELLE